MSLIRTLLAASSISDARGEIDQIAALVKRNPNYDLRLDSEITEAQVWAAEGRKADVITRLNSSVAERRSRGSSFGNQRRGWHWEKYSFMKAKWWQAERAF